MAGTSPSRLLRAGQSGRCRHCGNRVDFYQRAEQRPIALHPTELAATQVPQACLWHLGSGIAYPHGDGTTWCRIPHAVLCPRRTPLCRMALTARLRRRLAVRTRRLTDTGSFAPRPAPARTQAPDSGLEAGSSARPVVQLLLCRYLAEPTVEVIRCVAQTRHRHRCTHPVLTPTAPGGTWRLMPTGPHREQLTLPDGDLGRLPYSEQLRWRAQRCPLHAAAPGAAHLALVEWQPFTPFS
ncbi:DUF6083 domain-containing protein [Streptomyces sp. NPDC050674]|uniref:DUF6083 domain-containing protein n=1 Tax=Streptomyces sp. NPDC050674 TaxID=3157216 RepID=UPI00342735EB